MSLASQIPVPSSALRMTLLSVAIAVLAIGGEWFLAVTYGENDVACRQASLPTPVVELPEASGVAASRAWPDLLWAVNDSGRPRLLAIGENGESRGQVEITGAAVGDWEDISTSRCGNGSCVYIADIGDNREQRSTVRVYRLPEPSLGVKTRQANWMDLQFPDRPHDAEAMFVLPDDHLYVITKESTSVVYQFAGFHPGETAMLERLTSLPLRNVTDAEASADGRRIVVRTNDLAVFYRTEDLLSQDIEHGTSVNLAEFGERQGEGISFGTGNAVYLVGEGGGKGAAGTFLRLDCVLPAPKPLPTPQPQRPT